MNEFHEPRILGIPWWAWSLLGLALLLVRFWAIARDREEDRKAREEEQIFNQRLAAGMSVEDACKGLSIDRH